MAVALSAASCTGETTETSTTTETSATTETPPTTETATTAEGSAEAGTETLYPDVLEATANQAGDGTWEFSATLSSPYDSAERYADAWRVVGPDGTVFGVRELLHDHATEQPFTRSLSGVAIPDDVTEVTVEGRDQLSGWGGQTVTVTLER